MDERLYKAAIAGDTSSLIHQIEHDPLLLERRIGTTTARLETPLHIAAMLGHESFAAELARELDSARSSALHVVAAGDHAGVVRVLVRAEPEMCAARDSEGRNPVQIAAMMGRIGALKEMLAVRGDVARAVTWRGGTVLHLCVENSQVEALEMVLNLGNVEMRDLVNRRDGDGNTVLHLAVAHKQVQMIDLLLSIPGIELEAVNSRGLTPTDILMQRLTNTTDSQIHHSLQRAGAITRLHAPPPPPLPPLHHTTKHTPNPKSNGGESWLDRKRSALMVVASLIATMAFQFAVDPPPSVWAAAATSPSSDDNRKSVMYYTRKAANYLKNGERFYTLNTASFIASLSIILLLMSGLPMNNRVFVWLLMIITWVAISGLALSYAVAVILQTPSANESYIYPMFAIAVFSWICLVSLLLIGHTIRLFVMVIKMFFRMIKAIVRCLSVRPRRNTLVSTV